MNRPNPSRIDRIALDTETTGLSYQDRPVGLSWALPDGQAGYEPWGHGTTDGSQVDPPTGGLRRWMLDVLRSDAELILHHALFDLRMLAYLDDEFREAIQGIEGQRLHDTQFVGALHDENRKSLSLKALSEDYADGEAKLGDEAPLWEWLAQQPFTHSTQATRKAQGKYIARAPAHLVDPYARQDAISTLRTFEGMRRAGLLSTGDLERVYDLERRLLPVSLRMHLEGTPIHVGAAQTLQTRLQDQLSEAQGRWEEATGGVNVNSTQQLYDFFKSHEDELRMEDGRSWSEARRQAKPDEGVSGELHGLDALIQWTAKGNPSMAADVLEGLPDNDYTEQIETLRKLDHYGGTFVQSYLLDLAEEDEDPRDGYAVLHPLFHQLRTGRYGTVSGRYSSSNPNAQNIPARDKRWAPVIRGLFVPRSGCEWASIDYSQIEYRYLAHYADLMRRRRGERSPLAEAYEQNPDMDFHEVCATLAEIERKPAKNVNFMAVYGGGVKKTAKMLGLSLSEARDFLDRYHSRVPDVRMMYNACDRRAAIRGHVFTWYGRRRRFDTGEDGATEYTYRALNALLQGSAADLIKLATLNLHESGVLDWDRTVAHLTVHDELNFSVRDEAAAAELKEAMEELEHMYPGGMQEGNLLERSRVPIVADLELGKDWGACNEYCHSNFRSHHVVLQRLDNPGGPDEDPSLEPDFHPDIPGGEPSDLRSNRHKEHLEDV